jgi:hypothetical protein
VLARNITGDFKPLDMDKRRKERTFLIQIHMHYILKVMVKVRTLKMVLSRKRKKAAVVKKQKPIVTTTDIIGNNY